MPPFKDFGKDIKDALQVPGAGVWKVEAKTKAGEKMTVSPTAINGKPVSADFEFTCPHTQTGWKITADSTENFSAKVTFPDSWGLPGKVSVMKKFDGFKNLAGGVHEVNYKHGSCCEATVNHSSAGLGVAFSTHVADGIDVGADVKLPSNFKGLESWSVGAQYACCEGGLCYGTTAGLKKFFFGGKYGLEFGSFGKYNFFADGSFADKKFDATFGAQFPCPITKAGFCPCDSLFAATPSWKVTFGLTEKKFALAFIEPLADAWKAVVAFHFNGSSFPKLGVKIARE